MRRLLPLIFATVLIAGCGGNDEAEAPSGQAATRLTIELSGVDAETLELDCSKDPCDVDRLRKALAPPDPKRACTLIYGGPEKAHVTGTLDGEPVEATLERTDGCAIADYEALFAAIGREPPVRKAAAAPPADDPGTKLTVEVSGVGSASAFQFDCVTNPCDEATLEQLRKVVRPDPDRACPEIYGGKERARITGTLEGRPVDVTVDRTDGCGIEDYDALFGALRAAPPLAGG